MGNMYLLAPAIPQYGYAVPDTMGPFMQVKLKLWQSLSVRYSNFLSAFGPMFSAPTSTTIERDGCERSVSTQSSIHNNHYTNVHLINNNVQSSVHSNPYPLVADDEQLGHSASSSEGTPVQTERNTADPSLQLNKAMDHEFSPGRADETNDQYDNWYSAHLQKIQNMQQSWNRSGYDIPPHIPQDQGNVLELIPQRRHVLDLPGFTHHHWVKFTQGRGPDTEPCFLMDSIRSLPGVHLDLS